MSGLPATQNACDDAGRKVGLWTEADPHGGFMTGEYVNGERHGHWRHLAKDGRLRSEGPYAHGKLNGEWTWYRADGSLMQKGGLMGDEKHGLWERWTAQGQKIDSGRFDHGRKTGEWTSFNPDGSVKGVKVYR